MRLALLISAVLTMSGCAGSFERQLPAGTESAQGALPVGVPAATHCPQYRKGSGLLADGDLHQATDPGNNYLTFSKPQALAPHWRVVLLNVNLIGSTFWNFAHLCSIDLDGQNVVGAVAHAAVPVTAHAKYTVSFLFSGNPDCSPAIKAMTVSVGSQSQRYQWNTANGHDVRHGIVAAKRFHFTASSSRASIRFTSLDPAGSACGPVIGAIAVSKA